MKYYEVAAKWWAEKIEDVTTSHYKPEVNSEIGALVMVKAFEVANNLNDFFQNNVGFESDLARIIKDKVEKEGILILKVDYTPDSILEEVAVLNSVNTLAFPWKTKMYITEEKVRVTKFGKDVEVIYPSNVNKEQL